jgi:archaellum component FlaC
MQIEEVIKRLREFNKWRTGEDERTMEEVGIIPSQITKDIDFICNFVKNLQNEIRKCNIYMDIDFKEIQSLKNELQKLKK